MTDPIFWLGCSLFLVAISLTAVLVAAVPTLQEVARAARSAEKLCDTLSREFPPTLEAIRLTGLEISELTNELDEGVKSTGKVIKEVDRSLTGARVQIDRVQTGGQRLSIGLRAAWNVWNRPRPPKADPRP